MTRPTAAAGDRDTQLADVRTEARSCRACPLWEIGTQTVFGVGPATAELLFIGEAPGQHEDKQGVPFVGASGQLFDEALARAGLNRDEVYVTNTVKHRPWRSVNGRPKNRQPKRSEITACAPWLAQELAIIRPRVICCLGAIAAKAILGTEFRLTQQRGDWFASDAAPHVLATVHPSFVLIQPRESHERWQETFCADIRRVADKLRATRD